MIKEKTKEKWKQLLDEPVAVLEDYGLDVWTITILEGRLGIVYIRDLVQFSREELLQTKNIGTTIMKRLEGILLVYFDNH